MSLSSSSSSSSSSVINNYSYYDSSSSSSCSSVDVSPDEDISLNTQSSQKNKTYSTSYRLKRIKNNLSLKQSRVKKRMNDFVLEDKLTKLTNENEILRAKINMLKRKFGHLTSEKDELTSIQQPTVLNILDQSSTQMNHTNNHLSLTSSTTEQLTLENSSLPIKWRFKSLNIKSDS